MAKNLQPLWYKPTLIRPESINEHLRLNFYNNPIVHQQLQAAEQTVLAGEQTSFTAAQHLLDLYYNDLKARQDLNDFKEFK